MGGGGAARAGGARVSPRVVIRAAIRWPVLTPPLPSVYAGRRFPIPGFRLRRHRLHQNCLPGDPDVRLVAQRELAWAPALRLAVGARAAEAAEVQKQVRLRGVVPFRRGLGVAAFPG
jgi:hypothetical protein